MRKWNVVALLLAFGFIASPIVSAQSDDDLRREVDQLKRDLNKVMNQNQRILAENAELRDTVDTVGISALEDQINVLAESIEYAPGTSVNSKANPVTITGEFRVRDGLTFNRNFNSDEDNRGTFHDARFRVGLTFDFTEDVTTHFEMQANGIYGDANGFGNVQNPATNGGLGEINLYQGWIEFRNVFGRQELSNRTGRQEIVLGNEFIFGDNDFFSGETHDGMHWKWEGESFNLHVIMLKAATGTALTSNNHPYWPAGAIGGQSPTGYDDDELYSLYFTLKSIENHTLDLFWVYYSGESALNTNGTLNSIDPTAGFAGPTIKQSHHTVGLSLRGMFDVAAGLDYAINFAYQFGDIDDQTNNLDADIEGMAVEAEIGITFEGESKFRVFVRFLFSEGPDGDTGFIPLFMERHSNDGYRARYGLMDIMPVTNVLSLQGGLHFDPAADWTLGATVLWATTDEDVVVNNQNEDGIGFEIDVWAEYRYSEETTLSAGLGVFFADEAAPTVGGFAGNNDDIAILLYIQTRVVF